jgi:hypothetical protein
LWSLGRRLETPHGQKLDMQRNSSQVVELGKIFWKDPVGLRIGKNLRAFENKEMNLRAPYLGVAEEMLAAEEGLCSTELVGSSLLYSASLLNAAFPYLISITIFSYNCEITKFILCWTPW